jgi:hypothetical protein
MSAFTIDTLLRGQHNVVGFAPAVHVVGVERMLAELIEQGVLGNPVDVLR